MFCGAPVLLLHRANDRQHWRPASRQRLATGVQDVQHAVELLLSDVGVRDGRQFLQWRQQHALKLLQRETTWKSQTHSDVT